MWVLNSQPSNLESNTLTTRPRLPPFVIIMRYQYFCLPLQCQHVYIRLFRHSFRTIVLKISTPQLIRFRRHQPVTQVRRLSHFFRVLSLCNVYIIIGMKEGKRNRGQPHLRGTKLKTTPEVIHRLLIKWELSIQHINGFFAFLPKLSIEFVYNIL